MLKSVQNKILNIMPDDRPVTAITVIENVDKCPPGFYPIIKTFDQDTDADVSEKSIFKTSPGKYLCISKTEGLPNFVIKTIHILNEKTIPPQGFSILCRTADTAQKAWKKKQICYQLVKRQQAQIAVTDIIICSRLKKPPPGFHLIGDLNGLTLCFKMGNTESLPSHQPQVDPLRPLPISNDNKYPSLGDSDHDYEILRPGGPGSYIPGGSGPIRPAPKPPAPLPPQHSTQTLGSNSYYGLEGVPFIINPKFAIHNGANATQLPTIKIKTMQQLLKEYDYPFTTEREIP